MSKLLNKDKIDIVLYHGNCADGFGSAFSVWHYYKHQFGRKRADDVEYIPCTYGNNPNILIDKVKDKNILMCDFSFGYEFLTQLILSSKSFMILDHHKTAQESLSKIPDELKIFDMNRSGAGITWEYLMPKAQLPKFLAYIQDRDLWTNKLEGGKEFTTYLYPKKYTFELFESYLVDCILKNAIDTGAKWLEYKDIMIDNIAKTGYQRIHTINDKLLIVVYVGGGHELTSDIGNRVFKFFPLADFSAIYYYDNDNDKDCTKFSLRSTDGRSDVSEIAKLHDGGGHRNASGLSISGIHIKLPYPNYDNSILEVLETYKVIDNYILIEVEKFNCDYILNDHLDLLKRKLPITEFIVFHDNQNKYHVISLDKNKKWLLLDFDLPIADELKSLV